MLLQKIGGLIIFSLSMLFYSKGFYFHADKGRADLNKGFHDAEMVKLLPERLSTAQAVMTTVAATDDKVNKMCGGCCNCYLIFLDMQRVITYLIQDRGSNDMILIWRK